MLDRLGVAGVAGLLLVGAGLVLLALVDPRIAAGAGLVVGGVGLVAAGLVRSAMASLGMA